MKIALEDHKVLTPIPQIYLIRDYITEAEETYLAKKIDQVGNSNEVIRPDLSISFRAGGWQNLNGRRSMYWGGTLSPKGKLIPQSPPSFMTNEWPQVFKRLEDLNIFNVKPSPEDLSSRSDCSLPPNHCLVNEYNPGDGILPHVDGPAYLPTVATISLEADTVYDFYCYSHQYDELSEKLRRLGSDKCDDQVKREPHGHDVSEDETTDESRQRGGTIAPKALFSLFVPRRSLIIIESECYSNLLHSIPARMSDDFALHLQSCINWSDFADLDLLLEDGKVTRGRRLSLTCRRILKVWKGFSK